MVYRAALLLARGDSISQVAKRLRIDEKTLDRWKRRPEFKAEIEAILNRWAEDIEKKALPTNAGACSSSMTAGVVARPS